MSLLDTYRRQVAQHSKKISDLQGNKAREAKNLSGIQRKISSAAQAAKRTSSDSTLRSKFNEIDRLQRDEARILAKVADIEDKISKEHKKLFDAEQKVSRESEAEFKKRQKTQKQEAEKRERTMLDMTRKLQKHDSMHASAQAKFERLKEPPKKIKVLFLATNPLDQTQLRLDEEVRNITDSIRKSKHRDSVELISAWAIRPQDVLQELNEHAPTIIHFSGHGTDTDEIVFQDDEGKAKFVTKEALMQMMFACSGEIRFAFLNTCYSRSQAEALVQYVEAAIGMNTSISDDAARIFSSQFYSAIGFGLSLQKAFDQAKAMLMMEGIPEEETPELFVREGLDTSELFLVRPPE